VAKRVPDGMSVTGVEVRAISGCRKSADIINNQIGNDQIDEDQITGRDFTTAL
jgi:hypothetical protein